MARCLTIATSAQGQRTLIIALFFAGCALQLLGAWVVVVEIRDDRRKAEALLRELDPLRIKQLGEIIPALADHVAGHGWRRAAGRKRWGFRTRYRRG